MRLTAVDFHSKHSHDTWSPSVGTGKTYTMEGAKRDDGSLVADGPSCGIVVRSVRRIFAGLEASGAEWHVKVSFLEIYNERLDDLLTAVRRQPRARPQ